MRIPDHGQPVDTILASLDGFRTDDLPWRSGRAFGYVFDAGEDVQRVGKQAYAAFLTENALDPTEFPSLLRFENEIVSMCIDHLGGDAHCVGNFTSGGTESILLAVKAARDAFLAEHPALRPQIVLPRTGHAAFFKAAHYFGLEPVVVEVDGETFRAIPADMEAAITERTCLLVGSASGYAHGVVDPIEALGAIAIARGIRLHVDGCIGGFVLPFFRELGAEIPAFDFSVEGVTSISMDLHKYAYCPKGASVVLHRNKALRRSQIYTCASWSGYTLANPTVQSSRTGGPLAAAWAVLHHLGRAGYLKLGRALLSTRDQVLDGIAAIDGLEVLGRPEMCLVAFVSTDPDVEIFHVADRMNARGWYVQPQLSVANSPRNVHLSLTPSNVPHMSAFLDDLAAATEEVRAADTPEIPPMLAMAIDTIDFAAMDDATFEQLMGAAGLGADGELPEDRVVINLMLDRLDPVARERVLASFFNGLFVQP
jgi:glutamate/tyrosine decarboxylase-like PLP-dependent enzyme